MSSWNIADAKNADDKVQCLVFGYIKSAQESLELALTIPTEIFYLCILFLFDIECFEIPGDGISLSEDKMTITKNASSDNSWTNTSYGQFIAQSTSTKIVTWTIKIGDSGYFGNICIGIASSTDCQNQDFSEAPEGIHYCISDSGSKFSSQHRGTWDDKLRFSSGSNIKIILNLKDKKLSFSINGKEDMVGWEKIEVDQEISYRLAVSMRFGGDYITIIDFDCAY